MKKESKDKVKIIPLGGVEEIGINCTVVEYRDEMAVIDVGLGFPLSDQYGIDYVIPNFEYLKKNKKKIQGIIITHAHLDHIGGLPYILKELDYPEVFASRFSIEVIKQKLIEFKILDKTKIKEINKDSNLGSGSFEISFFGVTHSIPEAMGVVIKTPGGTIVHSGDFKFDNSPIFQPVSDYDKIARVGSEGVLALLSDSTNSAKSGHSKSEAVIYDTLRDMVENADGRIIVATFSSLVTRLQQLIQIAKEDGRKVAILGRSMENMIKISRDLGYINEGKNIFIPASRIKSVKDRELMVLATGAQGEHFAALARMGRGEHRDLNIKKGDTVVLSASIIPGNDMMVQGLIDELSDRGAEVFHHADIMDLHASGHGYKEDQKLMINLVKPKYFIPVHGYTSFLTKHGNTAVKVGVKPENVIVSKRGDVIELDKDGWKKSKKVQATPILVSGSGVGDIGEIVLSDREQLANYGVVIIVIPVGTDGKHGPLQVVSRGFVYVKESRELIGRIKSTAKKALEKDLKDLGNTKLIREKVSARVRKLLYDETQREPMILSIIVKS
ncbi:MAG: ribonuclease J [Candidatus Dojkabacteria bacterium]